jgi:hypothetical protein
MAAKILHERSQWRKGIEYVFYNQFPPVAASYKTKGRVKQFYLGNVLVKQADYFFAAGRDNAVDGIVLAELQQAIGKY